MSFHSKATWKAERSKTSFHTKKYSTLQPYSNNLTLHNSFIELDKEDAPFNLIANKRDGDLCSVNYQFSMHGDLDLVLFHY